MSLIQDFWLYCQSYEIPRNYATWSALGLMGAAMNRRIYIKQGDITHHGQMFICLVGDQGNKKSTPTDFARELFKEAYPDIPIGASMQTREDIVKFMSSDQGKKYYLDDKGTSVEYHPFMLFVNEFENFLSFNIPGMVSFLVDIYDRKFFDASTIKRGLEVIPNPAVNLIACCTPRWLINKLKGDIITGGICRRIIFVYETDAKHDDGKMVSIPCPVVTQQSREAILRVVAHLKKISTISGEFTWEAKAKKTFEEWYHENKRTLPDDPVMRGYKRTKDVQLLKAAMGFAMAEPEPRLVMTEDIIYITLAALDAVERNMPKLSVAAGRNELAIPQQLAMEKLEENGGWMTQKDLQVIIEKDLNPAESRAMLYHLKETDRIVIKTMKVKNVDRVLVMTKDFFEKQRGNGTLE